MEHRKVRFTLLALLLSFFFLGVQFHFCADLSAVPVSHFCPVCSTTIFAMAAESLLPVFAPISGQLRTSRPRLTVLTVIALAISPRSPPASTQL
jgi:hypothetical protein